LNGEATYEEGGADSDLARIPFIHPERRSQMKRIFFLICGLLIAAVVLPPLYYSFVPADAPQLPAPGRRIDVGDGVSVNATDEGSGRPIILVHGLPGSAYDWAPLSRALAARGHRVIAYDRVGYGHSDARSNDAFTPEGNADDLIGLIESEDLRDVTVVGWSYGGPVAIIAGRKDPSRIGRLVLIGSGGPSDEPEERPAAMALLSSGPVRWYLAAVPPMGRGLQVALSEVAFSGGAQPDWWLPNLEANFAMPSMRTTYYAEGERFMESELGIEEVDQSILLLHGDDDQLAPLAIGEWLARHAKHTKLIAIEDGSHMIPITHASQLADSIHEFVAGQIAMDTP
jgi:pimeloyl-ACP methyl ester carboxylesterase